VRAARLCCAVGGEATRRGPATQVAPDVLQAQKTSQRRRRLMAPQILAQALLNVPEVANRNGTAPAGVMRNPKPTRCRSTCRCPRWSVCWQVIEEAESNEEKRRATPRRYRQTARSPKDKKNLRVNRIQRLSDHTERKNKLRKRQAHTNASTKTRHEENGRPAKHT
jgi:hypothetical protein